MKLRLLLLGAAFLCTASGQAMAFGYNTCLGENLKWGTNNPTLRASPVSFPAGYWRNGLQRAIDFTNANPSPFFFTLTTDDGSVGRNNGQSEVWGTTDAGILQGHPAITYTSYTCYWFFGDHVHLDEADVIFDYRAPFQWTADEVKSSLIMYGGNRRQLQGTAVHEFGHALGLNHENRWYNVMGTDFEHIWANGSSAHGYLGEDASNATVFLYGLWSFNYQDLGVAHWKYSGTSGEYSTHVKTGIYNTSGGLLPTTNVNGETAYIVNPGQTVLAEFTYENNGKTTQTVNTGWYISNDDVISTGDRLIAVNTGMTLTRDVPFTYRRQLTIPRDLAIGRNYWLGTIVDYDNRVPDNVRSNNATYIPIRVCYPSGIIMRPCTPIVFR